MHCGRADPVLTHPQEEKHSDHKQRVTAAPVTSVLRSDPDRGSAMPQRTEQELGFLCKGSDIRNRRIFKIKEVPDCFWPRSRSLCLTWSDRCGSDISLSGSHCRHVINTLNRTYSLCFQTECGYLHLGTCRYRVLNNTTPVLKRVVFSSDVLHFRNGTY